MLRRAKESVVAVPAPVWANGKQRKKLLKTFSFRTSYILTSTSAASLHSSFDFSEGEGRIGLQVSPRRSAGLHASTRAWGSTDLSGHGRMQLRKVSIDFFWIVFNNDFSRNVSDFGEVEHSFSPDRDDILYHAEFVSQNTGIA